MPVEIDYIGEGTTDSTVAQRLITWCGGVPGTSYNKPRRPRGKDELDRRMAGLNAGARYGKPVLALRDLDIDAPCPGELVRTRLASRAPGMLLRICVPAVEAWLMADRERYARYFGVPAAMIPVEPERQIDAKRSALQLLDAAKGPFRVSVQQKRRLGVPDWAILGEWQTEFAARVWEPDRALRSGNAPSLARAIRAIKAHIEGGPDQV